MRYILIIRTYRGLLHPGTLRRLVVAYLLLIAVSTVLEISILMSTQMVPRATQHVPQAT